MKLNDFDSFLRSNNAEENSLTGAVIIGVKKCETRALMEMLKMHPQVALPAYVETEVKFWGYDDLFKLGLPYYLVRKMGPSESVRCRRAVKQMKWSI
jgi:hypothetical protein